MYAKNVDETKKYILDKKVLPESSGLFTCKSVLYEQDLKQKYKFAYCIFSFTYCVPTKHRDLPGTCRGVINRRLKERFLSYRYDTKIND